MKLLSCSRIFQTDTTAIVGVLNVTPDSLYAGSRIGSSEQLLQQAAQFLREGADMLEIGGESTGPGSKDIDPEEEKKRVLPAVKALRKNFPDAWIAVDTWKASVAKEALESGADLINDITAGRGDPRLLSVVSASHAALVLMYAKDSSPRTTVEDTRYDDVIATIKIFLENRLCAAEEAGIEKDRLIIDPGLGHFVSSDPAYSYEILFRLAELHSLAPILLSPSRKSFLAGPTNLPAEDRLPATIAASAIAAYNGTSFLRTHDVGATKRMLLALSATPKPPSPNLR